MEKQSFGQSASLLECCVDSVASACAAQKGGADRLELCSGLVVGGLTPSPALTALVKEQTGLPVRALIRPRFGDFLYSDWEVEQMAGEISALQKAGADGVVIGCLTPDGDLDGKAMRILCQAAGGLPTTLHRAFDMCRDPFQTLEDAVTLGIDTILTAGQQNSCTEPGARELLRRLQKQAAGRLAIMAGGGVNDQAIRLLWEQTGVSVYHMSGKITLESGMRHRNPCVFMGLEGLSEYQIFQTDSQLIRAAKKTLQELSGQGSAKTVF